jgi:hypothetical protein
MVLIECIAGVAKAAVDGDDALEVMSHHILVSDGDGTMHLHRLLGSAPAGQTNPGLGSGNRTSGVWGVAGPRMRGQQAALC